MSTRTASNQKQKSSSRSLIYWIAGGVIGLGLIVWLAIAIAGETTVDESVAFGDVTVEGADLPFLQAGAGDPAVGQTAPTVSAQTLDDEQITIGPGDNAKLIIMLAHWCPHCQAEIPRIIDWIDSGAVPEGVDVYGVTVLTNRLRDSSTWPPAQWLEGQGWDVTTVKDDADGSIVSAYGLTSTPTYVVLGPNNENLGRVAGEIGVDGLNTLARIAADSVGS